MHLEVCAFSGSAQWSVMGRTIEMVCHLHPILCTWGCSYHLHSSHRFLSTRTCLHLTLCLRPCLQHPSYIWPFSYSQSVLLLLAHHQEVCASIGSPVMSSTKWPTTYTRYFVLWMQLPPAPQSPFSFHLGCGYARKKKKKKIDDLPVLATCWSGTIAMLSSKVNGPVTHGRTSK